jgi:hypothetical protein
LAEGISLVPRGELKGVGNSSGPMNLTFSIEINGNISTKMDVNWGYVTGGIRKRYVYSTAPYFDCCQKFNPSSLQFSAVLVY